MEFKNTQNKSHNINGNIIWESRSVALNTVIIAIDSKKEPHVLISKRGIGTPDFQGYWNIPAGYLDRNETCSEGAVREVWEETNINVYSIIDETNVIHENIFEEWSTNSEIRNNRQNVSFRFGIYFEMEDFINKIELSDKNSEPNEIGEIKWIPLSTIDNYKFAFRHDELIKEFVEKFVNKTSEWVEFDENNSETYPSEGEEVLVTDGKNYDVAWYIMSSEYKWLKCNIEKDTSDDFTYFIPKKWKTIK